MSVEKVMKQLKLLRLMNWLFLFVFVVFGIVMIGLWGASRDTCELTCDPYVVEMCNMDLAVCRTPDGRIIREKKSKF